MNTGNSDKSLPGCNPSPFNSENLDPPPKYCGDNDPSLRDVDEDCCDDRLGSHALCDPVQAGFNIEDIKTSAEWDADRSVINRNTQVLRGTDMAMKDLFDNIYVRDEAGKHHKVPIIYGTQEKAVAVIIQDNVRKDNSLVVDRLRLPLMAIHGSSYDFTRNKYIYHKAVDYLRDMTGRPALFNSEKFTRDTVFGRSWGIPLTITYQLYIWTKYMDDFNQIFQQVYTKFSPCAYINVRGVFSETMVDLVGMSNLIEYEPGDAKERVIKFQFSLSTQIFVPQPIQRKKAILEQKIEFLNAINDEDVEEVISRLNISTKDLS